MAAIFETTRPSDYLLRVARSDIGRSYKSLALEQLDLRPGMSVMDLGCGPGADLEAMIAAVGPSGHVTAVDTDADALSAVADRYEQPWLSIVRSDGHALDIPDSSCDRAHTDRVLQHVTTPELVLSEVRRVLRPGGRAVFAEPDWGTLVIDDDDPRIADAYRTFVTEEVVRNARIGRELPRLAAGAGLETTSVVPITTVFTDPAEADQVLGFARVTEHAVDAGYLTREEASGWLDRLARTPFFASVSLFIVTVRRS